MPRCRLTRAIAIALPIAIAGCEDPLGPVVPPVGARFSLISVSGDPLPHTYPQSTVTVLADTVTILDATEPGHRVFRHVSVIESEGEIRRGDWTQTFRVRDDGVLEHRCPINALCTFSVQEARLVGDVLTLSYDGDADTRQVFWRIPGDVGTRHIGQP